MTEMFVLSLPSWTEKMYNENNNGAYYIGFFEN